MIAERQTTAAGRGQGQGREARHLGDVHRAPAGLRESQGAAQAQGGGRCGQRRRRARPSTSSSRTCRSNSSRCGTSRTAIFRRACPTPCSRRTAGPRSRRCANPAPTWASPGTATTTAASSTTRRVRSSRATTSSACWPRAFLAKQPGARIVYDPRLTWNTIDTVKRLGGVPVMSKSGHAFIKQKMREVDGAYGGEMSAHHYFRDFSYCDSGMIPVAAGARARVRVGQVARRAGRGAHQGVSRRAARSIASCRMRRRCWPRPRRNTARAPKSSITPTACRWTSRDWRFNVRASNTEPLVRLNVESRGNEALMREKTAELLAFLDSLGAVKANH